MANEKTISVDGKFTIRIGDIEMAVTREDAERLYSELYKALGKAQVWYPVYTTKPWWLEYPIVTYNTYTSGGAMPCKDTNNATI